MQGLRNEKVSYHQRECKMKNRVTDLLLEVTRYFAVYLEKTLPNISENWWENTVVNNLSFQQLQHIKQSGISTLTGLDLAALLRILDQNWYQISTKLNLTTESRHYIKEMITIRNRWAHASMEGFSVDDEYRDLDTLWRFAMIIKADKNFLQDIQTAKMTLVSGKISFPNPKESDKQEPNPTEKANTAEFEPGQVVVLKSNPTIRGAVVSILFSKPENRFKVFINGETSMYYASQLQAEDRGINNHQFLSCDQFQAYLSALQIRFPGLSTLYSLNAARIDFIPYQFRPVLKFIHSDRPRLLIADSVGVGKTIEAGLILRELQARRDIRSVLIICPRPLITENKWLREMKRFEERFEHLDSLTLRYCINEMDLEGVWPEQHQKIIIPYSLFDKDLLYGTDTRCRRKGKKGLLNLDPPPRFDLVIVDEAHHIRNQNTYSHKAVRYFCDNAEAVLFLTATPIQLGNNDLFVLLNTLRPDLIIDHESFEHMAEPNPFLHEAVSLLRAHEQEWKTRTIQALDQAATTAWGEAILKQNPEFKRIYLSISKGKINTEERVQMITDLESLHTFSGIINRTRRRDIGDFTIRRPVTVNVEFTDAQRQIHDQLIIVQMEILRRMNGDVNVGFMMTTIRRQAASCLFGLAPFLEEILTRHLNEQEWSEFNNADFVVQIDALDSIESQIHGILKNARSIDPTDPKLDALKKIIRDKQSLSNNKVMLFSSFRHTLNYLYEKLSKDGFRVGLIHGGTPDEDRYILKSRFEQPRENEDTLDVLLFSEIGCEGLDYQFCDCIVNYDLPWNPMRIEQRIGRIDRKGQKSESIAIYNLITPGTVDAEIYERCLLRIGVFNNALGGSEEILGDISKEIQNIAESLTLTDEERKMKLEQLAENKIRLIQEQEGLEQRQLELFGIKLPQSRLNKEIEETSSFWLSPQSIQRLVTLYIHKISGKEQEFLLGEKSLKTLRLSQETRNSLLCDLRNFPRQNSQTFRDWENWLKGGSPHLLITFESECALQHPEAVFIMPLHPLVKQAAQSFDTSLRFLTALKVQSNEIPAGSYEFAIYQWQFHGIREDLMLKPVSTSEIVTKNLSKLLEKAEQSELGESDVNHTKVQEDLDIRHHELWVEAREKHRQQTQELAKYRLESLMTSHKARIALLQEQFKQTENEKIQKMRQSQIATAEADYARHVQDLNIAIERADITAEPVAYGVLIVEVKNGQQ